MVILVVVVDPALRAKGGSCVRHSDETIQSVTNTLDVCLHAEKHHHTIKMCCYRLGQEQPARTSAKFCVAVNNGI